MRIRFFFKLRYLFHIHEVSQKQASPKLIHYLDQFQFYVLYERTWATFSKQTIFEAHTTIITTTCLLFP